MTKHVSHEITATGFTSKLILNFFFQANDLEETIKRIQGHKGVVGMMIVNNDGKCNPKSKKFGIRVQTTLSTFAIFVESGNRFPFIQALP